MKYFTDDRCKNWGVPFDYQGNNSTAPFCEVSLKISIFYINRIVIIFIVSFIREMFYSNNSYCLSGRHDKMGIAMLNRMPNSNDDPCVIIEDIWKQIESINIYCPPQDKKNDSEIKCTYPKGMFC